MVFFFEQELKEILSKISDSLWSIIISKELGLEAEDYKMQREGWEKLKEETEPLYRDVEKYIQKRLQSHGQKA